MSKHAPLRLTAEQFAAHQAKHGFAPDPKQASGASQMPQESSEAKKGTSTKVKGKKRGCMNRTEAEFSMILTREESEGKIHFWMYEPMNLRLGEGRGSLRYCPDFLTWDGSCINLIEVKGPFIHEKDMVRFKAFALSDKFRSMFNFRLHQKKKTGWERII